MRVINVGIYPPPYGGVSNHLKRLFEFLSEKKVETQLIDTSNVKTIDKQVNGIILRKNLQLIFMVFLKKSIIHLHDYSIKFLILSYILSFKHIIVISFHNERFQDYFNDNLIINKLSFFLLKKCKRIIVDNQKCKKDLGKFLKEDEKIELIPEFIPPKIIPPLCSDILIKLRQKHKFLLASNAFQISFHNGQDTYGIDVLIEALNIIYNVKGIDAAIIFLLPDIGDISYYKELNSRIDSYRLKSRFIFLTEPVDEASSIWSISDVIIRATNTDGNSLTIWEALHLHKPVIASNCVERPTGVILFESRDVNDLVDKIQFVVENLEDLKLKLVNIEKPQNEIKLLNLYKKQWESNVKY